MIMWIIFSFLIAILESSKDLIGRSTSQKIDPFVSAFALQFFAVIVLLPIILITGIPQIKPVFWLASIFTLFSIPLWSILYMKALTLSPLYISVPMLAFNPILNAMLSVFFDHRFPNTAGWMGIIFITIGLYLIRLKKETIQKGLLYPIINIKNEPGAIAMLGVAFIWSVGTHVAKIITNASSPLMFAFSVTLLGSISLFIIGKIKVGLSFKMVKDNIFKLGPLGLLNGAAEFTRGLALQIGYTPYVVAIARSNIVSSSLMGSILYKDKLSKINILGLLLVFLGIVLIIIV